MSETTTADQIQPSFLTRLIRSLTREYQHHLDSTVPHALFRYLGLVLLCVLYWLRVWLVGGFYIVTYALGIFMLNLVIGFLSPMDDPDGDGFILPETNTDEFKPFVRRLPEFKFWYGCIRAVLVACVCTLFPFFDVPVFWPILLIYFIVLFVLTMRRQIQHVRFL